MSSELFRSHDADRTKSSLLDKAELRIPFRYSNGEQMGVISGLGTSTRLQDSQKGRNISELTEYVAERLRFEDGMSPRSELTINEMAAILQNLSWHDGKHLGKVAALCSLLLEHTGVSLLAREAAAAALKNVAYYMGSHLEIAIKTAIQACADSRKKSDRILDSSLRALLYASNLCKELPAGKQKEKLRSLLLDLKVGEMLNKLLRHRNSVIAHNASLVLQTIHEQNTL